MDFEEAINAKTDELSDEAQYLTFRLESQEYALPIIEVQEINFQVPDIFIGCEPIKATQSLILPYSPKNKLTFR